MIPPKTSRKNMGGKCADPKWRKQRARLAGLGMRRKAERERLAKGRKFKTKGDAYAAGYRSGYYTAMQWWRRKFQAEGVRKAAE